MLFKGLLIVVLVTVSTPAMPHPNDGGSSLCILYETELGSDVLNKRPGGDWYDGASEGQRGMGRSSAKP
jgi:hypothetical protein